MKKRPLEILIISIIYMLLPLFYYFQVVYFEKVSALDIARVFSYYKVEDILLSLSSIVVGLAIFKVKTWGWYIFLSHAVGIIAWNFFVEFKRLNHPNYELILFSLTTLAVIGVFLRKHIKSPYFNPNMRWWEQEKRHGVKFEVNIKDTENNKEFAGKTFDISASGIFFEGEIADDELGKKVTVNFTSEESLKKYSPTGKIVWIAESAKTHPAGAGVQFTNIPWTQKRGFRSDLKKLVTSGKFNVTQRDR